MDHATNAVTDNVILAEGVDADDIGAGWRAGSVALAAGKTEAGALSAGTERSRSSQDCGWRGARLFIPPGPPAWLALPPRRRVGGSRVGPESCVCGAPRRRPVNGGRRARSDRRNTLMAEKGKTSAGENASNVSFTTKRLGDDRSQKRCAGRGHISGYHFRAWTDDPRHIRSLKACRNVLARQPGIGDAR